MYFEAIFLWLTIAKTGRKKNQTTINIGTVVNYKQAHKNSKSILLYLVQVKFFLSILAKICGIDRTRGTWQQLFSIRGQEI